MSPIPTNIPITHRLYFVILNISLIQARSITILLSNHMNKLMAFRTN
jgi:hypothetical protein